MYKASELELNKLLSVVLERNASDLHLIPAEPPIIRVDSQLIRLDNYQVLTVEGINDLLSVLLNEEQKTLFQKQLHIDFSYSFKNNVRFRVNAYHQKGVVSVALRTIPNKIKNLEELNLPPILRTFCEKKQGLILV